MSPDPPNPAIPSAPGSPVRGDGGAAAGVGRRVVHRFGSGTSPTSDVDFVAEEQPLEIRMEGVPLAVTMRTPGDDVHLALGFLFAEGVLASRADVGRIDVGVPTEAGLPSNLVDLHPAQGRSFDASRVAGTSRGTLTTASCGVCGRRTIGDLLARFGTVSPGPEVAADLIVRSVKALRSSQPHFSATGGVHGAAAFDVDGRLLVSAEDVGRHNAVDKVMGALLTWHLIGRDAVRTPPPLLVVSGRVSFEMVQKAAAARIPILAGVSAPTTLACELAQGSGMTLIGFVRGEKFNVYAHEERVRA